MKFRLVVVAITLFYLDIGTASAVSFDCGKAATASERLICGSDELSALDDKLALQFKAAKNAVTDDSRGV